MLDYRSDNVGGEWQSRARPAIDYRDASPSRIPILLDDDWMSTGIGSVG